MSKLEIRKRTLQEERRVFNEEWKLQFHVVAVKVWGAVCKNIYLTDLAQKLLSLPEIAISACRDVICGRDSHLCMQRYYLWQR